MTNVIGMFVNPGISPVTIYDVIRMPWVYKMYML